ncbi:hypothetical protein LTR94_032825, partial [Friedmanniomyces endolithicus]
RDLRRRVPRAGTRQARALHGRVRRPAIARPDADHGRHARNLLRGRGAYQARRHSCPDPGRAVLPGLARIARTTGETGRARHPGL